MKCKTEYGQELRVLGQLYRIKPCCRVACVAVLSTAGAQKHGKNKCRLLDRENKKHQG